MARTATLYTCLIVAALIVSATSENFALDISDDLKSDPNAILYQGNIVEHINGLNAGWTAGFNDRVHKLTTSSYKKLLGTFLEDSANPIWPSIKVHKHPKVDNLPASFDARERWPNCPTISEIRDQGHCGSCWAFGAVEALSDRFCVHLNESVSLSANDILSCCGFLCGDGCNGGWPYKAWRYFVRRGVVSNECQSYFDDVGCPHPGCNPVYKTPKCIRSCTNDNADSWTTSKHFAEDAYVVGPKQDEIKAELFLNGPVEVDFTVYEDFSYYKSGVYKHVYGGVAGGHAVKLIGWGTTDDGTDYWIIANSWNVSWGEDGYFRIVRGVNECGIEADVVAGLPSTKGRSVSSSGISRVAAE